MIRAFPRARRLTHRPAPAIDAEATARRFTHCTVVAMLAIAGLAVGLGLCWLADLATGNSVLALMFAL